MYAILVLGIVAFLFCLILTPLCRNLFLHFNIVDHPDAVRKLHGKPTPRMGGVFCFSPLLQDV
jgi:UDP-GlcNAc:undecaprenyl-phosphate GlcNAc-1-phosphate transferase